MLKYFNGRNVTISKRKTLPKNIFGYLAIHCGGLSMELWKTGFNKIRFCNQPTRIFSLHYFLTNMGSHSADHPSLFHSGVPEGISPSLFGEMTTI